MRYIDADELKHKLKRYDDNDLIKVKYVCQYIDNAPAIITARTTTEGFPIIDMRPRNTGEWIMEDKPYGGFGDSVLAITCSICKESYIYRDTTHNYCPNCGAYMRKEANNEQTN